MSVSQFNANSNLVSVTHDQKLKTQYEWRRQRKRWKRNINVKFVIRWAVISFKTKKIKHILSNTWVIDQFHSKRHKHKLYHVLFNFFFVPSEVRKQILFIFKEEKKNITCIKISKTAVNSCQYYTQSKACVVYTITYIRLSTPFCFHLCLFLVYFNPSNNGREWNENILNKNNARTHLNIVFICDFTNFQFTIILFGVFHFLFLFSVENSMFFW